MVRNTSQQGQETGAQAQVPQAAEAPLSSPPSGEHAQAVPPGGRFPRGQHSVNQRLHSISRKRHFRILREVFAGLFILVVVSVGLTYAVLSRGPISVDFLVPTIETAINSELDGITTHIESAILRRDPERLGIQFRLRNVRLIDHTGQIIAQAPLARVGVSARALLSGRLAPSSIDLIGPKLRLSYQEQGGLSLTFARGREDETGRSTAAAKTQPPLDISDLRGGLGARRMSPRSQSQTHTGPSPSSAPARRPQARSFDNPGLSFAQMVKASRRGQNVSSNLTSFGIRNATVVFSQVGGTESRWLIPDMKISLTHGETRSVLLAEARLLPLADGTASATGSQPADGKPLWLSVMTRYSEKHRHLTIFTNLQMPRPADFAAHIPALSFLRHLDMPIHLKTSSLMGENGRFGTSNIELELAPGNLAIPWQANAPLQIDGGRLRLRHSGRDGRILLLPSELRWGGGSYARFSGEIAPRQTTPDGRRWHYAIRTHDAALHTPDASVDLPPLPVDRWQVRGEFVPASGAISLNELHFKAADADIRLHGRITPAGPTAGDRSPAIQLSGQIGAMKLATLQRLWPSFLFTGARDWIDLNVVAGDVTGGSLSVNLAAGQLDTMNTPGKKLSDKALRFSLGLARLKVKYDANLPIVHIPKAVAAVRGSRFELDLPNATTAPPKAGKITLSRGRFVVKDWRPDHVTGILTFRLKGRVRTALAMLRNSAADLSPQALKVAAKLSGKLSGNMKIITHMDPGGDDNYMKIIGKGRLKHLKAPAIIGDYDITAGTLDLSVSEKAVVATGEVLVAGVPAKVSWQHIFDAPAAKQPPLRISATLNSKARRQLGFPANHILRGNVPTYLSFIPRPDGERDAVVEADLTGAELALPHMGWHKPRGQKAILNFTIVNSAKNITELRGFKVKGDDISIDGEMSLGKGNSINGFYFRNFSFNILTHIELSGVRRRKDNVLEIKATGRSFDGRRFFRSLFSAGQLMADQPPIPQDMPGMDITARIDSIIGYSNTTLKDVSVQASHRDGKLSALTAQGRLNGHALLKVKLTRSKQGKRLLLAESKDAGSAFRLIGFYPRVIGGEASLKVNLDGHDIAEKTGTLWARKFNILGDKVVTEVLSSSNLNQEGPARDIRKKIVQQRIYFDRLKAPFSVGQGQFILRNAYINGPLMGATLRGRVDFVRKRIDLGGTYIPAYGLNSALGNLPVVGQLLVGRRGEGLFGMTFGVKGSLEKPTVLVNPVSAVTPGIFRRIFDFTTDKPQILPKKIETLDARQLKLPAPADSQSSASKVFGDF